MIRIRGADCPLSVSRTTAATCFHLAFVIFAVVYATGLLLNFVILFVHG